MGTTKYLIVLSTIFGTFVFGFGKILYEGDACTLGDTETNGICKDVSKCKSALAGLKQRIYPQSCSFNGSVAIVCCFDIDERITIDAFEDETPQGKAEQMCECYHDYQSPSALKCIPPPILDGLTNRLGFDSVEQEMVDPRIVGGELASSREFPHMVALGYDNQNGGISWACGGSLISDRHILTAAHCLSNHGTVVKYARIGDVNMREDDGNSTRQEILIGSVIRHPDYKAKGIYNDIAILTLNKSVIFSEYARPACLNTEVVPVTSPCVATGWGIDNWQATEGSEDLKKADLEVRPPELCNATFRNDRKFTRGTVESMICAGDPEEIRDTCNGDSGGPLQVQSVKFANMHSIIGVTSYGTICNNNTAPAIYTRVSSYIPWIVNHVWPTPSISSTNT